MSTPTTLWHFEPRWTPWPPLCPAPQAALGAVFMVWQPSLSCLGTTKLCQYGGGGGGGGGCDLGVLQGFRVSTSHRSIGSAQVLNLVATIRPTLTNLLCLPYTSISCITALQHERPLFWKKQTNKKRICLCNKSLETISSISLRMNQINSFLLQRSTLDRRSTLLQRAACFLFEAGHPCRPWG